jgi:hypothetical protein
VHTHPRAVLEVRRVLLEHLHELQATAANGAVEPARMRPPADIGRVNYDVPLPPAKPAPPPQQLPMQPQANVNMPPNPHLPAQSNAAAAPKKNTSHCTCECCRPRELPKFDYSGLRPANSDTDPGVIEFAPTMMPQTAQ